MYLLYNKLKYLCVIQDDDELVKEELLDDQVSSSTPIQNERSVKNRRKIRKTD